MNTRLPIERDVPLAPRTTLELGGAAELFLEARDDDQVHGALLWAARYGVPVHFLGGGSNTIVPDEGVAGLVIELAQRGVRYEPAGDRVDVIAAAGEPWDALVEATVERGLAGLECLSGIPGRVGATPIQNVGAYGQEVGDVLASVTVLDRRSLVVETLPAAACGFAYRDSLFKRHPDRFVVLEARFSLERGAPKPPRYAELAAALGPAPSHREVRETVLRLRRAKSMVLDPNDPNRRSAGSYFTNPIVDEALAAAVVERAVREGIAATPDAVPRWPAGPGRVKLAAGWLVEKSGMHKGLRRGPVGISSAHALSLVHHGGGTTRALLALEDEVRAKVRERFGVVLEREPVVL